MRAEREREEGKYGFFWKLATKKEIQIMFIY